MSEGGGSRKVRKTGSPKVSKESEAGGQKSEEEKSSEIEKLPIANSSRQLSGLPTEKMEVHHHPEVEKKGFKEYLLEGLMIFIAVMMGFFAESLRERISEHRVANEFAATLYSDLKADTADLKGYINYTGVAAANVDTLMQLLSAGDPKQAPSGKLYWFGLWGGAYRVFIPHDATLLEMKSSGSLRYFASSSINRQLAQYDQLCQGMRIFENNDQGIFAEVRKARAQLFDFKYNEITNNFSHIKDLAIRRAKIDSFIKTNPPLLSYNKILFNEYVEMVRSRFLSRKVASADTLFNHATALINTLKKEYPLDDE